MSDQLQNVISEKLAAFTKELVELYRSALINAVSQVVGGGGVAARTRGRPGRKPGRPKGSTTGAAAKPAKGGRRSSSQISATADKIQKYVAANPGKRAEEIKKALSIAGNQWGLPVAKLLETRKIRTTGARRATKYFPAGK
jgi:hypothetical protein